MSDPVVTVKQGVLRGVETDSITEGSYLAFRGIPYAAPPIGDLRFRDPQPLQPWTGVRDASKEGPKCAHFNIFSNEIVGDDDCLYLNVATTSLTGSRPVMVWIHGGGFVLGDGGFDTYGPDYLMGSGIVYVGINYRLGVLGFLNLDHEVAPGNMGLKDQVAALKWVKENISQFGGDPNNVTIFGQSAGGASVHYLLLSPLARGLFHKAIAQSGVVLNPWARVRETVKTARQYVAALGKDTTDPQEIVEYLRTIPVRKLVEIQDNMATPEDKRIIVFPFAPSVDNKSVEPFMPKPHEELVAEGFDVPTIIGYNSHEGILSLMGIQDDAYKKLDENFETTVPRDLAAKAPSKVPEIAREIRKHYFGNKPISKDSVDEYIQCYGDLYFGRGVQEVVEIQRQKKSPTFFYKFSYDSPHSSVKKFFQVQAKGAMHAAETEYLFFASQSRQHNNKIEPGSTEALVQDRLIRMWTDFAKTGNPTPFIDDLITEKWEPVTRKAKNYLEINAGLSSGVNPDEGMWDMWQRVYAMVDDN